MTKAKAINFTQAQIIRAVRAVESVGLKVRRVTIAVDGSIVIDTEDNAAQKVESPTTATSWDDV
jgi:hypothetical protein